MASVVLGLQAVEIECEFKSPVDEVKSAGPTNLSIGHILHDVRLLGSFYFMFLLIIWDIIFVSKLVYSLKYFQQTTCTLAMEYMEA